MVITTRYTPISPVITLYICLVIQKGGTMIVKTLSDRNMEMMPYSTLILSVEDAFIELLHCKDYTTLAGISDALHKHYFKMLFEKKYIEIKTVNEYLTKAGFIAKGNGMWQLDISLFRMQMRKNAEATFRQKTSLG